MPLLLLLLLLACPAALAQPVPEEAAYREVFSVAALGAPSPSLAAAASFGLAYRGMMPHAAFAIARDAAGRSAWGFAGGAPSAAAAEQTALERCQRQLGTLQAECRVLATDASR